MEKRMTNSLLKYFGWSIIQHALVLACTWFIPVDVVYKVAAAITLFTACHIPNLKLMAVTFTGGSIIYSIYGLLFWKFSWLALLAMPVFCFGHAFIGRYLIEKGMEMRVLWLYPKEKK